MAALGKYQDLPLPEEWIPVLEGLRIRQPKEPLPDEVWVHYDLALEVFHSLDKAKREVLWKRLVEEQTLEKVGIYLGVTRERVRQIEKMALKILISSFWKELKLISSELSNKDFYYLQTVNGIDRTNIFILFLKIIKITLKGEYNLLEYKIFKLGVVIYNSESLIKIEKYLIGGKFFEIGTFNFKCSDEDTLNMILLISNRVYLTSNYMFTSKYASLEQRIVSIAEYISQSGFTEFHFSEMAKAYIYIFPDSNRKVIGRNIAAVFSRTDFDGVQYAGRRGYWMLRRLGDGFDGNKDVIAKILEGSDIPLHQYEIFKKIDRNINEGTVYAILARDSIFHNFGRGIYGLLSKQYNFETEEEEWLLNFIGTQEYIEESVVHRNALREGLDLGRLRSVVGFSGKVFHTRSYEKPAYYESLAYYAARQMKKWLSWPESTSLPQTHVLLEGTRQAFGKDDYATILKIKAALEESRREIPEDFHDYFFVAENNV